MKTYNIDIVKDKEYYYILDFSITKPVIGTEISEEKAIDFARGYKTGIEIDSSLKYQPKIQEIEETTDIKKYVKEKKKYYEDLWKNEK